MDASKVPKECPRCIHVPFNFFQPRKRAPRKEELLMCLWQSEGREPSETELEDSPVIKRNHNQNKELFQKHFGSDFGVKVTWSVFYLDNINRLGSTLTPFDDN